MSEPRVLQAGDTWTWSRSESDYPASEGWALVYYFAKADEEPQALETNVSGDGFTVTVAASSTAWPSGIYRWTARVSRNGEVHTIDAGQLTVIPDPTVACDRRSYEEKVVAALEPALLKSAGDMIIEYEIDGTKVKKDRAAAIKELDDCRSILRARRRAANGQGFFTRIPVVFS